MATRVEPSAGALLLVDGDRVPLDRARLTIGRDRDCDIVLDSQLVSRVHAAIIHRNGAFELTDESSANGTRLNGEQISGSHPLGSGDTITIGPHELCFVTGEETQALPPEEVLPHEAGRVEFTGGRLTIGRDPANDITLDDPNVSRRHAEIVGHAGVVELRDLGSRNGTRLDGAPIRRARLAQGARIGVGPFDLVFDGEGVVPQERGPAKLEASGIEVYAGKRRILPPTTFSVQQGELVAIIGSSGTGKSTLVKALVGMLQPDSGSVTINDEPVQARLTDVGYVPQDEIVHRKLTPREALTYAARLRLPEDVSREEVAAEVGRTLEQLSLDDRADDRIETLSGGERQRAGFATELLGRPSILVLDEPTTGLDPDLERRTMELLRSLADESRGIAVVTHATRSLELCDRLVVVGPGGYVHYSGPPRDAPAHLGVESYEDMYEAAATRPIPEKPPTERRERPSSARLRLRRPPVATQLSVLLRRYVRLFVRDRRNLAILLLQAPFFGLVIGALYGHDVFSWGKQGNSNDATQILFMLVITTLWMGAVSAAREIIKERAVIVRERAVGVGIWTYLTSKVVVLLLVGMVQVAAVLAIVVAQRSFHASHVAYAEIAGVLVGTSLVAIAMGLAVSALARSQDQAVSFIPLAVLPQLLLGGAIVPVSKMSAVMDHVSQLAFARWSFSALGTVLRMAARIAHDPHEERVSPFKHGFFGTHLPEAAWILALFFGVFLLFSAFLLRRRRLLA